MKLNYNYLWLCLFFTIYACREESTNVWNIPVDKGDVNIKVTDLSHGLYKTNKDIKELRREYPFFFSPHVPDSIYVKIRRDSFTNMVYKDIVKTNPSYKKVEAELQDIFARMKHYCPGWQVPQVYVYTSDLESVLDPVLYLPRENKLFIAMDAFLGKDSRWYEELKIDRYLRQNMVSSQIAPSVVDAIARQEIPYKQDVPFLGDMIFEGKVMLLKDALLPSSTDANKIGYSAKQMAWCYENEYDIWNYFIENQLLFKTDKDLINRFISVGPYSKFYNDVQAQSPSKVGTWVGWQIMRGYQEKHKGESLCEMLKENDYQVIFKESGYKPKKN